MTIDKLAVVLLLTGALLAIGGCSREQEKTAPPVPVIKGVTLETAKVEPVQDMTEVSGTVRARNSAVIAARIPGTVVALHAREGDRVSRGKVLLSLESVEGNAGAAGARAAVDEAQRAIEASEARKVLAEATYGRYQKLFDQQAVTRQEYEGKQMEQEVARQELARARARLAQAREFARSADTTAGYSRIVAPISGTVTVRGVEVGMTVFPGTHLMTIEEESGYRLEIPVPEAMLGRIRQGDSALVSIEGAASQASAKVSQVVPVVDPASRSFLVKVDLSGAQFRSGMYGRAFFPSGTREGIFIPKGALFERGALSMVWVAGDDNSVRMRLVKTGPLHGDNIEVVSGISAGERLVVAGGERLVDGARVE